MNPEAPALLANRRLSRLAQPGQLAVGESQPLHPLELRGGDLPERGEGALGIDQLTQLIEEPGVDAGSRRDLVDAQSGEQRVLDLEDALRCRGPQGDAQILERRAG